MAGYGNVHRDVDVLLVAGLNDILWSGDQINFCQVWRSISKELCGGFVGFSSQDYRY